MKWKPNETLLIVFEISLQYQIRMNFKDKRTITILFIFFFHLENIITKISLVNERPYKMAKPASLYPGEQRFYCYPRVRLDASVSATGRWIFGQRPVDLTGHNLKTCLTPETAYEKSLAPTVENALRM